MIPNLNIHPAAPEDAHMLADIRVESMRPSLEAINRFDPVKARDRLLSSFAEKDTFILYLQDEVVGFYVFRTYPEHLYLDHFYLKDKFQGIGVGKTIVTALQAQATTLARPIRLIALKESPANIFYRSMGFIFERDDGVDNHYRWEPENSARKI